MTSDSYSASSRHASSKPLQFGTNRTRTFILGALILGGAIIGAPALSVGPSTASGEGLSDEGQLDDFHPSFDLIGVSTTMSDSHASYAERRAGPVTFPEGAIEIPWTSSIGATTGRAFPQGEAIQSANVGTAYSVPTETTRRAAAAAPVRPQVMNAALRPGNVERPVESENYFRTSLAFDQMSTDLTQDVTDELDLLSVRLQNGNGRIVLRAFGGTATTNQTSTARRLALRRALAVRNYLMARGVDQERMIVRAIGQPDDEGPSDRVDLLIRGS